MAEAETLAALEHWQKQWSIGNAKREKRTHTQQAAGHVLNAR